MTHTHPVPVRAWRTSSRSQSSAGQCVEVGPYVDHSGRIAVRDTKDRTGPVLTVSGGEWAGFVRSMYAGAYDA